MNTNTPSGEEKTELLYGVEASRWKGSLVHEKRKDWNGPLWRKERSLYYYGV